MHLKYISAYFINLFKYANHIILCWNVFLIVILNMFLNFFVVVVVKRIVDLFLSLIHIWCFIVRDAYNHAMSFESMHLGNQYLML